MTAGCTVGVVVHRDQPARALDVIGRLLAEPEIERVVVVDNDSCPSARATLAAGLDPRCRLESLDGNTGFGPGVNHGVRVALEAASTSFVVVAAHDALFAPGACARLIGHLTADPRRGAVSGDVGDAASPLVDPFLGAITEPQRSHHGFESTVYPHGTLLALSRPFVEAVGLFDPRYFAYCEEADLGLRAARANWVVGIARDVAVRNPQMAANAAVIDYLQLRNTLLLLRTHFGARNARARLVLALFELAVGTVAPARRDPFFSGRARRLALRDHLLDRYGPPPPSLWRDVTPG